MSAPIDDGGPAFPHSAQPLDRQGNPIMENHSEWGMSLRDWFAGQALGAILSSVFSGALKSKDGSEIGPEDYAVAAYANADAMLAARKEGK